MQKDFHDLVISTYGRGLYIFDDITPLEQQAKSHADAAVTLFEPRHTYRFSRGGQAMLNFSLKTPTKDLIHLEILDAEGKVIRKLETKGRAGMNRVSWDLRYESAIDRSANNGSRQSARSGRTPLLRFRFH